MNSRQVNQEDSPCYTGCYTVSKSEESTVFLHNALPALQAFRYLGHGHIISAVLSAENIFGILGWSRHFRPKQRPNLLYARVRTLKADWHGPSETFRPQLRKKVVEEQKRSFPRPRCVATRKFIEGKSEQPAADLFCTGFQSKLRGGSYFLLLCNFYPQLQKESLRWPMSVGFILRGIDGQRSWSLM